MGKLRFGVIGLGIGGVYARHLKSHPYAVLTGICDMDRQRLARVQEQISASALTLTDDYQKIIADPNIDAVIVATPDNFHRQHAIEALDAGKHVLCEKPVALTLEDCQAIIEAEQRSKTKFFVGQVCRYAAGFAKAKKLVDAGVLGELFFVESEYAHDYSHMDQQTPNHWRRDPKLMRYPFVGGACHAVDLVRWLAGDPVEVSAYGSQKCLPDWPAVMDATIAIYRLPNQVTGKVFCSIGCKRPYTMRTTIYGTEGTIICDNTSSMIQVCSQRWLPNELDDQELGFAEVCVSNNSHNFKAELDDFIDIVVNDRSVTLNAVEGAKTVAVCVATVKAALSKRHTTIKYF